MKERVKIVFKTSVVGILVNISLAIFKIILGTLANSISVKMDGINNLSDAASSLITIVGTMLAKKPADKKHPFGYGRIEHLSSLVISGLVLYAGLTAFVGAVSDIIKPEEPEYTTISLIVIAIAVVIKFLLSRYTLAQGKKAESDSLMATGKESILDVVISISTLVAALIYISFGVALEAYLAAVISLIIIKTGAELLLEIVSKLIGDPGDAKLIVDIKNTITSYDNVYGAYDLILNDYGPDNFMGSVHIEVDDTLSVKEVDYLIRAITEKIYTEYNVVLTAVGIYSHNTTDKEIAELEREVKDILCDYKYIKSVHGFFVDKKYKKMHFDMVVSLDSPNRWDSYNQAVNGLKEKYPDYVIESTMDIDFNELAQEG